MNVTAITFPSVLNLWKVYMNPQPMASQYRFSRPLFTTLKLWSRTWSYYDVSFFRKLADVTIQYHKLYLHISFGAAECLLQLFSWHLSVLCQFVLLNRYFFFFFKFNPSLCLNIRIKLLRKLRKYSFIHSAT